MARQTYSVLLGQELSVGNTPVAIGAPEAGYTWVVRTVVWTFGDHLLFSAGGVQIGDEGPGLWLVQSPQDMPVQWHKWSGTWEGRLVVPPETTLYVLTYGLDTVGDVHVSGYNLNPGY